MKPRKTNKDLITKNRRASLPQTVKPEMKIVNKSEYYYTCVNCISIPYFRLFVFNKELKISFQCTCKGIKMPFIKTYSSYENFIHEKNKKTFNCLKHGARASLYCVKCQLWICPKCNEIHSKTGRTHLVLNNMTLDIPLFCTKHSNEKLIYCCSDCKTNLCEKCIKVHNDKNNEHIKHIYSKNSPIINRVKKIIEKCKEIMKRNQQIKEKIVNMIQSNNKYSNKIKEIEEEYKTNVKINNHLINFVETILTNIDDIWYLHYNHFRFLKGIRKQTCLFIDNISEINEKIIDSFIYYLSSTYVIKNQMIHFERKVTNKLDDWIHCTRESKSFSIDSKHILQFPKESEQIMIKEYDKEKGFNTIMTNDTIIKEEAGYVYLVVPKENNELLIITTKKPMFLKFLIITIYV